MQKLLIIVSLLFVLSLGAKAQETVNFNSYKEMVAVAKKEVQLISIDDFHTMYTKALSVGDTEFTLIDIRTVSEFDAGFIPGAFLVQRGVLESRLEKAAVWEAFKHEKPENSDTIILYCRSGSRSALAAKSLQSLGYTNVKSLEGGWSGWNEKFPNLKKLNN
jgi:rhodanese-related sulfurtransferase